MGSPYAMVVIIMLLAVVDLLAEHGWKSMMCATFLRSALLPPLILTTVLRPQGLAGRLLDMRLLRWLGKISYSLYLWQQLFLVWGAPLDVGIGALQSFPLGLACALLAAWMSFTFIERPMIIQGRVWRAAIERKRSARGVIAGS
jgi:peptidoglycan/LPS O-acetylase OafA/YrhL